MQVTTKKANMEFPMNLQTYGQAFEREVELAQAIYNCGKFQIEDHITAGRVAKAFDRYIFLITNFETIAKNLYGKAIEKDLSTAQDFWDELWVDKWDTFSQCSGLAEQLNQLKAIGQKLSNKEKIQIILQLHLQVSQEITELTPAEQQELGTVTQLAIASNPLSNSYSLAWKLLLVLLFAFLTLLTSQPSDQI